MEKGSTQAEHLAGRLPHYARADRELAGIEAEAKAERRGLSSRPNPPPPWEWRHPKVADTGRVIVNCNSRLYHAPNCRNAGRIKPLNRVTFETANEAEAAGYRKAEDCN